MPRGQWQQEHSGSTETLGPRGETEGGERGGRGRLRVLLPHLHGGEGRAVLWGHHPLSCPRPAPTRHGQDPGTHGAVWGGSGGKESCPKPHPPPPLCLERFGCLKYPGATAEARGFGFAEPPPRGGEQARATFPRATCPGRASQGERLPGHLPGARTSTSQGSRAPLPELVGGLLPSRAPPACTADPAGGLGRAPRRGAEVEGPRGDSGCSDDTRGHRIFQGQGSSRPVLPHKGPLPTRTPPCRTPGADTPGERGIPGQHRHVRGRGGARTRLNPPTPGASSPGPSNARLSQCHRRHRPRVWPRGPASWTRTWARAGAAAAGPETG